jgi:hypothetical protein
MWEYYLAYCEGGFAERYIGDAQLLLRKAGARAAVPVSAQRSDPAASVPARR